MSAGGTRLNARIPTQDKRRVINKILKLYTTLEKVKKHRDRKTSPGQAALENKCTDDLNNLFDIAHADALKMIDNEEDKEFLLSQREKGRRGNMQGKDLKLFAKESRSLKRKQMEERRKELSEGRAKETTARGLLVSSTSGSESVSESDPEVKFQDRSKKKKTKIIDKEVTMALDRTGVSTRTSMRILSTAAKQLGHNLDDISISKSTIHRTRRRDREDIAKDVRDNFDPSGYLVVHWDGKKMNENPGAASVEYLPVVVSGTKPDQILGIPQVSGTGVAEAEAVVKLGREWGLDKEIKCDCFDTTSSNTGVFAGACVKVEEMLGRSLLHLACRHHILEIILSAVFKAVFGPSTGPDIPIFHNFRRQWTSIDPTKFKPGILDQQVRKAVAQHEEDVIRFAVLKLQEQQPRDDYKEFLELVIVFLGATPPKGVHFVAPGALHQARFMAKAIYCLKMFLFRFQVKLNPHLILQLKKICIFVINHYVVPWFTAPLPTKAPNQDLILLQSLLSFHKSFDAIVTLAALDKLSRHLWYLGEHLVVLSLFDSDVSIEVKRKMISALKESPGEDKNRTRKIIPRTKGDAASARGALVRQLEHLPKTLDGFITTHSMGFFKILEISADFVDVDPQEWPTNDSYKAAVNIVEHLRVVNDTAERGVALAQIFKGKLTKDKEEKQSVYQVVHKDRREKQSDSKKTYL